MQGRTNKNNNSNDKKKEINRTPQNNDKKEKTDKKDKHTITTTTKPIRQPYYPDVYPPYEDDSMSQQIEKEYNYQEQLQIQEKVNIQLLLRRQKNYNNTFRNCYDTMKEYINNPTNITKGNFLWNIDCCCSMVSLWKKDYPEYVPQFSKQFNKEEVVKEINKYIQIFKAKNDIEHFKIFTKFFKLLNNERQDMEDDKTLLKYFPEVKTTENNLMNTAHNLIKVGRKIQNETETEEFFGFPNYDVDDKLKHLREKGNSS